ncbi:hypothetical protein AA0118_g9782 [Alternaria tenuissima]|nr:hypothetical protein AA0118_g9782 [Alternaria tenuissima]RYO64379.1 hypothetical protein AA0116_g4020 [Alternaria tenuissima]
MEASFSRFTTARSTNNVIYAINAKFNFKSNFKPIKRDGAFQGFMPAPDGSDTNTASTSVSNKGARSTAPA